MNLAASRPLQATQRMLGSNLVSGTCWKHPTNFVRVSSSCYVSRVYMIDSFIYIYITIWVRYYEVDRFVNIILCLCTMYYVMTSMLMTSYTRMNVVLTSAREILGIVGQDPSDSNSSRLHVDNIFQFCFIHLRYILL